MVGIDEVINYCLVKVLYFFKTLVLHLDDYIFEISFVLLNCDDLLDRLSDIEYRVILDEVLFVLIQNGIIEDIMHEKVNKLSCARHLFATFLQSRIDFNQVIFGIVIIFHFLNDLLEHFKKAFHGTNLADQRIQWVSELMRYGSIDKLQKLLLSLHLIVKNLIRDINYLYKNLNLFCLLFYDIQLDLDVF